MTVEEALKWVDRRGSLSFRDADSRDAYAFPVLAYEVRRLRYENRIAKEGFQAISRDCDRISEGLKSLSLMGGKEK